MRRPRLTRAAAARARPSRLGEREPDRVRAGRASRGDELSTMQEICTSRRSNRNARDRTAPENRERASGHAHRPTYCRDERRDRDERRGRDEREPVRRVRSGNQMHDHDRDASNTPAAHGRASKRS